jgi:hypothetical protein
MWLASLALLLLVALLVGHDVFETSDSGSAATGSGVSATATRHVAAFSGVELAGSNDVVIRVGEEQSVTVRGDDNLLRFVTTGVRADRLVIGTRGSFSTAAPMSVTVAAPSLDTIVLSGSGRMIVTGVDAESLTVALDGSGLVVARGAAERVVATLAGSGNVELQDLIASNVEAVVSGSGQIRVYATSTLSAGIPGSGVVFYGGHPAHVTKTVSGTGAVVAT